MAVILPKVPDEPLVDKTGVITPNWLKWLVSIFTRVYSFGVSQVADTAARTAQEASIGPTPVPVGDQVTGHYRLGLYGKVTRPSGATSSLQLHAYWTDPTDSTPQQYDSPVINGNVVDEVIQVYIPVDATAVSYGSTYASTGAPVMQYKLTATLEALPR